jgi:hypothetical protein
MGSLCSSSTNTTTTVNTPPPQVLANYQDLVDRAKALGTDLQHGPQQPAAALTQQQLGGINNIDLTTSMAAPYFGAGLSGMSSGFDTVGGALGYLPQSAATLQGALGYLPQGAAALQGALSYIPQGIASLGKASDYYSQGAGMASAGAAPIHQMQFSKQAVDQYMSPYTANVIDTTLANIQHQNMVQQNALRGTGILGGNAFGGDRAGVAAAELGRGQAAVADQTIATLWDKNYSQALNEFNVQQAVDLNTQQNNMARMLQAAGLYGQFGQGEGQLGAQYGQLAATQGAIGGQFGQLAATQGQLANVYNNLAATQGNLGGLQANIGNQVAQLGPLATQTAINSANAQIAAGTVAQQTYQNQINAEWNAYLLRLGIPSYNLLSGAVLGTGASSGGTSQTLSPGPSPISQIAGLAIAGIGAYNLSDEREKENIKQIGTTYDGQPLYRYNFKGSPKTEVGLLAQDVEQDNPAAVGETGDGLKMVNYDVATRDAAKRGHYASGGGVDDYGDSNDDDSGIGNRLEIAAANALAREFAENVSANDHAARLMSGAGYASGGYTGNDPLSGAGGMGGYAGGYGTTGGYGNSGGYGAASGYNYTGAYNDTGAEDNTSYRYVNPTTPGYAGPTPHDGGGYGGGSSGYTWQTGTKFDEIPGESWQQFAASADPLWANASGVTPLTTRPPPYGSSGRGERDRPPHQPPPPPPTEEPPPSGGGDPLPPDPDPYVPPPTAPRPPLPPEHRNHPYYQASQVETQPGRYAEGGSTSGENSTMRNNRFHGGLAQLQALRDQFANGNEGGGGFAGLQALRNRFAGMGGGGGGGWGSQAWRDRLTAAGWTPPATTPTPTPEPTPTPTPTPEPTEPYTPPPLQTAAEEMAANGIEFTPPPHGQHEQDDPAPGGRGGRGGGRGGGNTQQAPVYQFPGQTWQDYAGATDPTWGRAAGMTPDSPWYQPPAPTPPQIYDDGARGYPAPAPTNPNVFGGHPYGLDAIAASGGYPAAPINNPPPYMGPVGPSVPMLPLNDPFPGGFQPGGYWTSNDPVTDGYGGPAPFYLPGGPGYDPANPMYLPGAKSWTDINPAFKYPAGYDSTHTPVGDIRSTSNLGSNSPRNYADTGSFDWSVYGGRPASSLAWYPTDAAHYNNPGYEASLIGSPAYKLGQQPWYPTDAAHYNNPGYEASLIGSPAYKLGQQPWYPTDAAHYNNPAYAASIAPKRYASGGYVDDISDPFSSNVSDQVSGIKNLAALRRAGMSSQNRGTMPRMGIPTGSPNIPKQTNEGLDLLNQMRGLRKTNSKDRIDWSKMFGGAGDSGDPLDLSPPSEIETGATGGRMGTMINDMMIRRRRGYRRGGVAGAVDGDTFGRSDRVKKKFRLDFL